MSSINWSTDEWVYASEWLRVTTTGLRTKVGELAFSYAGPVAWNSLPVHVWEEMDIRRFKSLLKTYTFSLAYNVY